MIEKMKCKLLYIFIFITIGISAHSQFCAEQSDKGIWIDPDREGNKAIDIVYRSVSDTIVELTLPFAFQYQGKEYTNCFVGSDGSLFFSEAKEIRKSNLRKNKLTVFSGNSDIYFEYTCPPSTWKYELTNEGGGNCFVITWKAFIYNDGGCGEYVSYQAKLFETTNILTYMTFENTVSSSCTTIDPETTDENTTISSEKKNLSIIENTWTLY